MKAIFMIGLLVWLFLSPAAAVDEWKAGKLTCANLGAGAEKVEPVYDSGRDVFVGGKLLIPEQCVEEFKFEDMVLYIQISKRDNKYIIVNGTGRTELEEYQYALERTQIVVFRGMLIVSDPNGDYYVEGLKDLTMDTTAFPWSIAIQNLPEEDFYVIGSGTDITISKTKGSRDKLVIKEAATVIFSSLGIECDGCTYAVSGDPDITILSRQNTYEEEISSSVVILEGKPYTVGGVFYVDDGHIIVPGGQAGMVNGVYVQTISEPVTFYFEGQSPSPNTNYVHLKSSELVVNGKDFDVAIGTGEGGYPSPEFPYPLGVRSDYLPDDAENERLLFQMFDGNVRINKEHDFVKASGDVAVTNGVNRVNYFVDENGKQKYNYQYVGCVTEEANALCREVPYTMFDGGTINVKSYVLPSGQPDTAPVTFLEREPTYTVTYDLDTDKVYALGYKGGGAARAVAQGVIFSATEKEEYKQWGHAGLLYYRDGQWWVAEADGQSVKILPVADSLFANHIDGVFEVNTRYPDAIIQKIEQDYAGLPYGHITRDIPDPAGIYCGNLVSESLAAAADIPVQQASFTQIYMAEESTDYRALAANMYGSIIYDTPLEVLNSPALSSVEPSEGILYGSEAIYAKKDNEQGIKE